MSSAARFESDEAAHAETRQRLLEAAGEVFAEVGFRAATVREICQRAGANVAAVNYHFGDKQRLYLEVLRYSYRLALEKFPLESGLPAGAPAEERLRAFVRSFLLRIFDKGRFAWRGRLISREMVDPTGALDALVQEEIRPQAEALSSIVRQLAGDAASEEFIRSCGYSIVSQCVFYHHCQPVICRLFPEQRFDRQEIERLAGHITRFSLAALQQLAQK
ncbi:MAG: CerR family C-terminal domain-containing protein [Chloroflexi bacterium]|nr:CerR family C-terminal domain-containing protein [Chloroflexota bacterium]